MTKESTRATPIRVRDVPDPRAFTLDLKELGCFLLTSKSLKSARTAVAPVDNKKTQLRVPWASFILDSYSRNTLVHTNS